MRLNKTAVETAPLLDLNPEELEGLLEELEAYHALYRRRFGRREPREWSKKYLMGLLMQ